MSTTLISLLLVVVLLATGAIAVCTTNDLRIVGNNPNQGTLQICKSSNWYSVCGNSWGCSDAKVACRQMGFTGPIAYYSHCCGYFGTYNPRDNRRWHCSSNHQSTLASCGFSYFSQCSYSSYYYYRPAGIRCNQLSYTASTCSLNVEGDIRLQSGSTEYEGRLEVCYGGRWSSVCNVDSSDAAVACKQLGHSQFASVLTTGYGSSQSAITSLTCQASYNHLNECTINGYSVCSTSTTLTVPTCSRAIRCTPMPSVLCPEGAVRLVDGDIEQEGRVEVCFSGVWGSICRYGWSASDAYVACKQLGYDPGIAPAQLGSQFGSGDGPVVYSYVNCMGFENSLSQCSKTQYPSFTCLNSNYIAGIRCYEDCSDGDIRLTGGLTDAEGTVEICRGNLWGLVTEVGWNNSEAQVVCRQLGVESQNAMAVSNSHYGRPRKSMHYSHVSCTGAEDRLTQCAKTSISLTIGKTTYINESAAAVSCHGSPTTQPPCVPPSPPPSGPACQNNQIRLMGGQASNEGRLEYCYNGQWSPFCTLRSQEATVACRQLGYTHFTGAAVMTDGQFGSVGNYSLFRNITCSSSATEARLEDCTLYEFNAADCLPSCPNIGIRCYTPGSCSEGAVRLMDGVIQQEGRIEVCLNGVWGSLCDQAWDKTDTHVLCQELGYAELEPVAYHNSYFGAGYGPILYSNVSCGGWETSFAMCSKNEFLSFSCPREHTAGLLCGERCSDGEIRLVGGSTNLEGTVEICFGNLWGLIAESGWGDQDAAATCRQLGFLGEGAVSYRDSHFGKPNKTIHASGVTCAGDEQTLTDCTLTTYPLEQGKMMASSIDVAGVSCQVYSPCAKVPAFDESNSCINDSIRLSGGAESTEGRLEYCYQGSWTPLCSAGSKEATVACRQLGYIDYDWASVFTDGRFGTPNNVSYFQTVSCTGNEVQLKDCNLNDSCSSSCASTIGIRCYNVAVNDTTNMPSCPADAMRLVGGTVDKNGRVEVCLNGVWGTVCADGWGVSDAFVACKQLGMGEGRPTSITNSSMFGEGNGPVVYSNVICHGWESNIVECPKDLYGTFECPNTNVAGVICRDVCSAGDVRLMGGAVESEGTVEICSMSLWGLISATNWVDINAEVVCGELGYQSAGSKAVVDSRFGKPSRFVHLSNVQCSGEESKLADCTTDSFSQQDSTTIVDHIDVAGVICINPSNTAVPTRQSMATMPTRSSTTAPTADQRFQTVQLTLYGVIGVMAVLLVVGLLVIIILVVVVIARRRNAVYGDKDQLITGTMTNQQINNPVFMTEDYKELGNEYDAN